MFRSLLALFMIFFSITVVQGQQGGNTSQELMERIKNSQSDTNRVKLQLLLGKYYFSNEDRFKSDFKQGRFKNGTDSAFYFFNQALQLSDVLHSVKWRNEALELKGNWYLENSDFNRGKDCFMQIINYYHQQNNAKKEAEIWTRYGSGIPLTNNVLINEKIRSYENARTIYKDQKDTLGEATALKSKADALLYQRKLAQSEAELLQVLVLLKAIHYRKLHYTFDLLAALNKMRGDLNTELFYRLETIKSIETTGDMRFAPNYYYSLSLTYYNLGMYNQAKVYVNKVIAVLKKLPGANDIVPIALNARILLAQKRKKEALFFLQKNVNTTRPLTPNQLILLDRVYGDIYQELGQYKLAEKYFQKMIFLSDRYQPDLVYFEQRVVVHIDVCNFYIINKQYKKANQYLQKLLKLPKIFVSMLNLSKVALLRFKVDSASGNYISAIKYFELQKKINDSLFNATKSRQIEELEVKYEISQKEKDIQLQQKNIQILKKQSELERNQMIQTRFARNIMIGGLCLLALLSGVLYNRYRLKKRSNLLLEGQKKEISAKNTTLKRLLQDNEWLLKEVHHRVKNNMQIVISLLNSQSAYLKDEAAIKAVKESRHRIQAMSLIHQKLYKTNDVSNIYMPEYINEVVDYLKESFKTEQTIYFNLEIDPIILDVLQALPVGLIINEAITNAIKYAFPYSEEDCITIKLTKLEADHISLSISDNGRGLPGNLKIDKTDTFGMILIKGLAEDLGGEYTISNNNGITIQTVFRSVNSLPRTKFED